MNHNKDNMQLSNDLFMNKDSFLFQKINKQISNIENDIIKKNIENSFDECLKDKKIDRLYIKQGTYIKEAYELLNDKNRRKKLLIYSNCLMDYYLIARSFRSYEETYGYSRPSYNNIIYAGNTHVKKYVKILKKLGYDEHFKKSCTNSDDKSFQCLDISKMEQPMFHQRY